MHQELKNSFYLSTSAAGVLGVPSRWQEVWGNLSEHDMCGGYEVIMWRWGLRLLKQAQEQNLPIAGLHGRIGWRGQGSVAWFLNQMLIPTPALLSRKSPDGAYLLVHQPELQDTNPSSIHQAPILFIENVSLPDSLNLTTTNVIRLQNKKQTTGLLIDVFHLLLEIQHRFPRLKNLRSLWTLTIKYIDQTYMTIEEYEQSHEETPPIPIAVHLPIGTAPYDSLPVRRISPDMWQALGNTLHQRLITTIIEAVEPMPHALLAPRRIQEQSARRYEQIFTTLCDNRVLR